MPVATITITYAEGAEQLALPEVYTADTLIKGDYPIAAAAVNAEIDVAFSKTAFQLILISSDQAVTIKTNSTGAPGDTIALPANKSILIRNGAVLGGNFAVDVTKLFISNGTTSTANVKVRVVTDTTP
jgi:hypothetical protein